MADPFAPASGAPRDPFASPVQPGANPFGANTVADPFAPPPAGAAPADPFAVAGVPPPGSQPASASDINIVARGGKGALALGGKGTAVPGGNLTIETDTSSGAAAAVAAPPPAVDPFAPAGPATVADPFAVPSVSLSANDAF